MISKIRVGETIHDINDAGAIRFDAEQDLSTTEQTLARSNMAAAPVNSPSFTGTPTAPNPAADANSNQIATTQWVQGHLNDTKVTNTVANTTKYYITGTTVSTTSTDSQVFDTGVYATSTEGELSAVRHSYNEAGVEKAYTIFNASTASIDFVFI